MRCSARRWVACLSARARCGSPGCAPTYDPAAAAPETTVAAAQMPILLIHSRTDNFTPYTHSEAIYANSDQSRTVLHINDWGSLHAADIGTDFPAYQALFEAFLAQYAPDFGRPMD